MWIWVTGFPGSPENCHVLRSCLKCAQSSGRQVWVPVSCGTQEWQGRGGFVWTYSLNTNVGKELQELWEWMAVMGQHKERLVMWHPRVTRSTLYLVVTLQNSSLCSRPLHSGGGTACGSSAGQSLSRLGFASPPSCCLCCYFDLSLGCCSSASCQVLTQENKLNNCLPLPWPESPQQFHM